MKISILGPPGSGKGTIAKILSQKYNLQVIGAGDIIRKEMQKNTPEARLMKEKIDKGEFMLNGVINKLIKEKIQQNKGYILDGFPRHFEQLKELERHSSPNIVLKINVDKKKTAERLRTRIQCTKCREVYNTKTSPTKKEGICDICSSPVGQREDDKKMERIEKRNQLYEQETKQVEDYYLNEGKLEEIDGNYDYDKIDLIVKQCENKIKEKLEQGE